MKQNVKQGSLQDGSEANHLPSRSGSRQDKDAGTDDRPDAQCSQRPRPKRLAQSVLRPIRVREQLINALGLKILSHRRS